MPIMEMGFFHTRIIQLGWSAALANYAFLMRCLAVAFRDEPFAACERCTL
jgi:hypothetical protein